MRYFLAAGIFAFAPLMAQANTVFEATVTDVGGFDVTAASGSSFPTDSSPFVGTIFGGEGVAISGVESFSGVLASGAFMSSLAFDIYEPTSSLRLEGCNTTCVDSTFKIEFFSGASLIDSFAGLTPVDDAITNYSFNPAGFFDRFVITETQGTNDNEFFANFSAEVVPLPAGLPLFLGGLAALGLMRHRANRRK